MKRYIFSSVALAAASMLAWGENPKNLVITDIEDQTTTFDASEVSMVYFQPVPEYEDLPYFMGGSYEEKSELGVYRVEFATARPDSDGLPPLPGDVTMSLVLNAPWTDDIQNPELVPGYYRIGNGTKNFTFDAPRSVVYIRTGEEATSVTPMMIIDGTIDIRKEESGQYDIRFEMVTLEGYPLYYNFLGDVELPAGVGDQEKFTEDLDITFQGASGRFYGNWYYPFAADMTMQLWSGEMNPSGSLKEGYILNLDFSETKPENPMHPNQRVADGVYKPENREGFAYTYLPFTFNKGEVVDFMGMTYVSKTRLEYQGADGSRKLGLITDGSFTVSNNGSSFLFDLITEDGIHVRGTYNGVPNIGNYCDNDEKEPQRPYSSMQGDKVLNFPADAAILSYNDGETILEGLNTLTLIVAEPAMTHGDYVMIDLLSDDTFVADGTYTMTWDLGEDHMIPGTIDYAGGMLFSWYGDLDSEDPIEGYHTVLACLASGTITLSTNDDNTRTVVFNLVDDAGNTLTGQYTGPFIDLNQISPDSPAARVRGARNKAPRLRLNKVR